MERTNPCLELKLDEEHSDYELVAREAVYREVAKKFPKKCECGREYRTEDAWIRGTEAQGPAKNYREIHSLAFMRNCKCKSTMAIALNNADFNAFESYSIFETMRYLGELGLAHLKTKPAEKKAGSYCWKLLLDSIEEQEANRLMADIPLAREKLTQIEVDFGLNIFRYRYNDWVMKIAATI